MSRREAYTKLAKTNQERPPHVAGKGDAVYKGFQCPTPDCQAWLMFPATELESAFEISCGACSQVHASGDVITLFDYNLVDERDGSVIQSGSFDLLIDDYVEEAGEYKYCVLCYCLKPLSAFARHASRASGHQGECTLCKTAYNGIKNQSRLQDQHREAAQKRRLVVDVSGRGKIDSAVVRARFGDHCFGCGTALAANQGHLDHTLPVFYLWPLTTDNATLLCAACNGQKTGRWPAEFYPDPKLRRLAALTGLDYRLLAGPASYNPDALARLQRPADVGALLARYAAYMDEVMKLRNRILDATGVDFFATSPNLSPAWTERADGLRRSN